MAYLSDEELRRQLKSFGFCPGPISDSTRKLYQNKLQKLCSEDRSKARSYWTPRAQKQAFNYTEQPYDSLRQVRANSSSPLHKTRSRIRTRTRTRTPSFQGDSDESEEEYEQQSWRYTTNAEPLRRPDWQERCQNAARRNVFLERQLSRCLVACTIGLAVLLVWLVYVKTVGLAQIGDVNKNIQLLAVDCKGKKDSFCAAEENRLQMQLLSKLYNFLAEVAGDLLCGNPSKLKNKCVCLDDIKTYFSVFYPEYLDRMDDSLLTVLQSRKDFGIRLVGEDVNAPVTAVEEIHCLESTHPSMSLWCRLQRAVVIVVSRLFIFMLALLVLWGVLVLLRYRWKKLEEEDQAMYELVRKIIGAVRDHYKDWDQGLEPIPYVPIPHIRDTLIPPQNRRRMRGIWDKAVEFLASNESRIRTETHRIAGEDFLVWRWTQPSEISDSS
ncbi:LEM domain-containing protein 2-like [Polypterus senegalus]|uniref:LEM domain-containing protein 2-like n=1 Tax=Polypterus senegalus TaxID=55291 RepID=UPI0019652062|nr:LEM domain-containing protein 2-like [Polypterus senegalus]